MTSNTKCPPRQPVVAVDLGGTKLFAGAVDLDGTVLSRIFERTTDLKDQPGPLLDRIAQSVRDAAAQAGLSLEQLGAVGLGIPGPLDAERAVVSVAPNLGWGRLEVRAEIERRLPGPPVFLENDVRAAALAEHRLGAGRGYPSMVAIFVGTGVGGGLIIDGRVYHGARGGAGEVGHILFSGGGLSCPCGRKGCLEALAARGAVAGYVKQAVASGKPSVLVEITKGADLSQVTSGDVARAISEFRDAVAIKAVLKSARYVGLAIGGLVNLLDPHLVVIGGGVAESLGEPYVVEAARAARTRIFADAARDVPIVASVLGDDAGLLGAAMTAYAGIEDG